MQVRVLLLSLITKKTNMPTLNKLITITITPEQFLEACSMIELQEIELNIGMVIRRKLKQPQPFTGTKDTVLGVSYAVLDDVMDEFDIKNDDSCPTEAADYINERYKQLFKIDNEFNKTWL
jgi:hypothetical protein